MLWLLSHFFFLIACSVCFSFHLAVLRIFFFFKYYYYSVGGERGWGEGYLELRVESGGKWTFLSQDITCVGAMRKGSEGGNRTRLGEISGGVTRCKVPAKVWRE